LNFIAAVTAPRGIDDCSGERLAVGGEGFATFLVQGQREGLPGRTIADSKAGRFEPYAYAVRLGEDDSQSLASEAQKPEALAPGTVPRLEYRNF